VSRIQAYRVATGPSEAEYRIKASRFIATAGPISDLAEASDFRDRERKRFHDATHHVYGVVLHGGQERFDDDGEPSGTAGRPTLSAIERAGLSDVVVAVTRYFGGTKLGTGGLARAYGAAADLALELVPVQTVVQGRKVLLTHSYADTGLVARLVETIGVKRLHEWYGDQVELEVALPAVRVGRLRVEVAEATAGRAALVELAGEMLLPYDT
jgi:uncharacterized YigZ family protein